MTEQILQSGQIFAQRYRVERLLARGGFGAVYVAEQLATEAHVAVKVLWPHILSSQAAVTSFQQEARIAGRVGSEHIVRVLDAGFDEPSAMPYLVMELLDGQDLQRVVEQSGALSPELTVSLMRQVASALDRAHRHVDKDGAPRPIVHRDLKPENIFLTQRENGEPLVKVLDFGIAKVTSATAKVSHEVKGTPLYMAYEQASGGVITHQTDVWALGLIVFFLLTGRSYWKAAQSEESSLTHLFGEVLSLPIVPPSARLAELGECSNLPYAFDGWFFRCVNRETSQRFASAGEAIAALHEVVGIAPPMSVAHRPSVASDPLAELRAASTVPITPSLAAPGATAHSLALSGIEQRPRKGAKLLLGALVAALLVVGVSVGLLVVRRSVGMGPPDAESATAAAGAPVSTSAPKVESNAHVEPSAAPRVTPVASSAESDAGRSSPVVQKATTRPLTEKSKPKQNEKDKGVYGER